MDKLRVCVIGDSAVWGQGLKTENKFYLLAANRIAQILGREAEIVNFTARSGAKILAATQADTTRRFEINPVLAALFGVKAKTVVDHRTFQTTLPSGKKLNTAKGDRVKFYETYPAFFASDEQVIAFLDGTDEEVARQLFGDVPSTFPTVTYQIARLDAALAASFDLVIMDGSVNDIDFEGVLDSMNGPEIAKIDLAIRAFAYDAFKGMVSSARKKFPRAVLLITGYFSPFSQLSDQGDLEDMAKYLSGKSDILIFANDVLTSTWGTIFFAPLALPLSITGTTVDVGQKVREAIFRSELAYSRGTYWLRRAVAELFAEGRSGAGMYFVNPGFRPENSLFAPNALLHEGYKSPDEDQDSHTVKDAVLQERLSKIPRHALLEEMKSMQNVLEILRTGLSSGNFNPKPLVEAIQKSLPGLIAKLDGPLTLPDQLRQVLKNPADIKALKAAVEGLGLDIGRIQHGSIASFVHPNEAGARQFANRIVERFNRQRQVSVRAELARLAPSPATKEISVRDSLRHYGLDARTGVLACLQHSVVDSLAIEIKSLAPDLPFGSAFKAFLNVGGGKRFRLNNPLGTLSTIDTFGALNLGDIRQLSVEVESGFMDYENFRFSINGVQVFQNPQHFKLDPGEKATYKFPV